MERIQVIQDQITEIGDQLEGLGYHERDAPERDDFKEMTTLYNTLVQELSFFEVQPRFDPIEVLPEEVWLAVLKEALTVREHEISYLSVDMALYLTCISSKWRRSIESAPILWTDIILDDAKQDLAMKVSISLIKSGASFLSILIGSPMCCWHDIGSSLIPHKERIRHTYVYSDDLGYSIQHFLLFIIPQLSGSRLQPIKWTHGKDLELGDQLFVHKESKKIHSLSSILLSKAVFSLPEIRNLPNTGHNIPLATFEKSDILRYDAWIRWWKR
ncbi:hypothetical protein M408DRAFT_12482 [Serendipita vermifera MAFF 305830]|uniref:F-box domain-containing protein n=1 Tax=Serendipita vermifera MAFF 305830 TaxID=933852 RepID=A0A0C3AAK7_SERVB|nr:hypothetical protein M408DRAFT_12482 [Serendipita vermifera MAFF 305830]